MTQSLRPRCIRRSLTLGALSALLVLTGCGSDGASVDTQASRPTPIAAPAEVNSQGVQVVLGIVDGGDATGLIITDHRGFALYGVSGETTSNLVCVDDCTTAWIPLTADGRTGTADGLDPNLLGSLLRPNGITQVTYADIPLYLWTGDNTVGITGGAGVAGIWFALTEAGGFLE